MKSIKYIMFLTVWLTSYLPLSATQGRSAPYFPYFNAQHVVRGLILDNEFFYHAPYANVDMYSLEVKMLNKFDLEMNDTITLLPDTTAIDIKENVGETASHIKEGQEYFINIEINKYDQICFVYFLPIVKGKVQGNLTHWSEFWLRLLNKRPRGMSVERFERKLKKKLESKQKNNNV